MKHGLALCALFALAGMSQARPTQAWTYDLLVETADLVVVATPIETKDTDKTVFPNAQRQGADGKREPVPAVGIETKFKVLAVFKGDKKLGDLTLYHLKQAKPENVPNGPQLVSFDPKKQQRYLMLLKREADGKYISVTGQIDAAVGIKAMDYYP